MKKTSVGGKYIKKANRPDYYFPSSGTGATVELVITHNASGKDTFKLRRSGTNKFIGDGWKTRSGALNYAKRYNLDVLGG